jgi:hypothetical protein
MIKFKKTGYLTLKLILIMTITILILLNYQRINDETNINVYDKLINQTNNQSSILNFCIYFII